jgi:ribosomal protein S4
LIDRFQSSIPKLGIAALTSNVLRGHGNRRLSRTVNRQNNAAGHRIAATQMRCHDDARTYLERRMNQDHKTKTEALRALKRRLSDIVYRALLADTQPTDQAGRADLLAAAA